MPKTSCPHCGRSISIKDDSLFGKKGKCPGCQQSFVIEPVSTATVTESAQPAESSDWWESADDEQSDESFDHIDDLPPPQRPKSKKKKAAREADARQSSRPQYDAEGLALGEYSLPVHYLLMAGTGFAGGLVGAILWCLITFLPIGSGWGALFVGVLVGCGVRLGASKYDYGWGPAITALTVALFAITLGKAMAYNLEVWQFNREFAAENAIWNTREGRVVALVQQMVDDEYEQGTLSPEEQSLIDNSQWDWDDDYELQPADFKKLYPERIWQAAETRYDQLSPAEQAALSEDLEWEGVSLLEAPSLISIFDIFFFILAGWAAFATAAGWELFG